MIRALLPVVLLAGLSAFAAGKRRPAPAVNPSVLVDPKPVPSLVAEPLPSPSPLEKVAQIVTLKCDGTCNDKERGQLNAIERAMNQTLTSDCFLAYFGAPGLRLDFTQATGQKVVAKMWEPTTLTLSVYYKRWTRAEGYEQSPDYNTVHMNRYFTGSWPICSIASLGLHEMSHGKGFWHQGNSPGPNYYSVPYQINHATEGTPGVAGCCQEPARGL